MRSMCDRDEDERTCDESGGGPTCSRRDGRPRSGTTRTWHFSCSRAGLPPSTKQPITRDALRARLGVSNQVVSELLRQLRAAENRPPAPSRAA
jgi:hypothetical protein